LTQKLYDTQLKEYNQFLEKYKQGLSSEVEKKVADIGIQKLKLQLENLQRQVDNGKIQFNQAIGVDVSKQFNFTDEKMIYMETKSYDEYLKSALANRAEILAAKIDIDEKQQKFDLASKYFSETELTYVKASEELDQANSNYESLCKQVEMEVQEGYFKVKQKQSEKQLADRKLQQAQNQYNNAKASYDAGLLQIATLWNAELGVNQAQMNVNKALRDYNNSLYEFEKNCEAGTEYVMEGA
ncbi:MAG: TolC family protein, partial [Solirubrobacterales bacterium]